MSWIKAELPKRIKREPIAISDAEDEPTQDGAVHSPNSGKKRKRPSNDIEDAGSNHKHRVTYGDPVPVQLAHQPYTKNYPTAESIHHFITTTDAIRATKAQQLTVQEIRGVIDVLVWDNKLERIGGGAGGRAGEGELEPGYRTVRGVKPKQPGWCGGDDSSASDSSDSEDDEDVEIDMGEGFGVSMGGGGRGGRGRKAKDGNGLTQAPCGRCPVFDLCGPGGKINAGSCIYFNEWLHGGSGDAGAPIEI